MIWRRPAVSAGRLLFAEAVADMLRRHTIAATALFLSQHPG
jgi:hypothetical protein